MSFNDLENDLIFIGMSCMIDPPRVDVKEAILIFIRGVLMGSADIVPGVSGGTIALITGIYGHLVIPLSGFQKQFRLPPSQLYSFEERMPADNLQAP